jgi:hypothetical protein
MKLREPFYLALVISVFPLFTAYAENPPQSIKSFVEDHYNEIQNDLHQGNGASIAALLDLLHTPSDEKEGTIKRLHALSEAYPTLSEFAERVPDFENKDLAPAVSTAPAIAAAPVLSESDLVKLFGSMKYKTHIHLSMLNGEEIDGSFSSFDKSRGIIWLNPAGSSSVFGKKPYGLLKMKNVTQK